MKVSDICAAVALLWLVAGVAAGIFAQAELFSPGISGAGSDVAAIVAKKSQFNTAILLHGCLMQVSLPLAACAAVGMALLGERRRMRILSICAVVMLVVSAAIPAVLVAALLGAGEYTLGVSFHLDSSNSVAAGFMGFILAVAAVPESRLQTLLLGAAGLVPLAAAGVMGIVLSSTGGGGLADTYYYLARDHAFGLCLALWTLAVLLAWAGPARTAWPRWLASAITGTALLAGLFLVMTEARLGLQGMPRHYIDYADGFFPMHRAASWAGFVLAASMIAGAGLVLFLRLCGAKVSDAFS